MAKATKKKSKKTTKKKGATKKVAKKTAAKTTKKKAAPKKAAKKTSPKKSAAKNPSAKKKAPAKKSTPSVKKGAGQSAGPRTASRESSVPSLLPSSAAGFAGGAGAGAAFSADAQSEETDYTFDEGTEETSEEEAGDEDEEPESRHPFEGQSLPNLRLKNQDGEEIDLANLAKSTDKVVLYFYPKDDTPGCTKQACGFRDSFNRLKSSGITVIGISPDSPESHQKFIKKFDLNFPLLSDTDKSLSKALNVWKEKNFMGKKLMGIERSTFVLNKGKIARAWQPVSVEGHVDDVLTTLEKL